MEDREMMELAAKAAGLFDEWPEPDYEVQWNGSGLWCSGMGEGILWNPLTDDGDALRLAASMRLQIKPGKHLGDGCTVETQRVGIAGCTAFYDDKAQQMRQAITRAAAEIGKAMP